MRRFSLFIGIVMLSGCESMTDSPMPEAVRDTADGVPRVRYAAGDAPVLR